MAELAPILAEIDVLILAVPLEVDRLERTLTDGYAHALALEAEKWRLEKRLDLVAHGIDEGDTIGKTRELTLLTKDLDRNASELAGLRKTLANLRRRADEARVAS
jgi:hypothetical protein